MTLSNDSARFTPSWRSTVRDELIQNARDDARIVGAALLGSAAIDAEDDWSDIDLALSIADARSLDAVVDDWTELFYKRYGATTHFDMRSGSTLYRVFLLRNTLQVDISFWLASEFRAVGRTFKLVFGDSQPAVAAPLPSAQASIGMAWLYALHVRSSIARGRLLQAEFMLSGMRQEIVTLLCLRHKLQARQARGADELPKAHREALGETMVGDLDATVMARAFGRLMRMLIAEIRHVDPDQAGRLETTLTALASA